MTAPTLPPPLVSGQCPQCGRRCRNLPPVRWSSFPQHTDPETKEPCEEIDLDLGYAVNEELTYLLSLVDVYQMRLDGRRAMMRNPLRGERPGDLKEVRWFQSRIAVLSHRADRLREALENL